MELYKKYKHIGAAFLITLILSPITANAEDGKNGIRFDDPMQYKKISKDIHKGYPEEMDSLFNQMKAMKKSGAWRLDENSMEGASGGNPGGTKKISVGKSGGLLNSIPSKYKNSYLEISENAKKTAKKSGWSIEKGIINNPKYHKAIKDNLATQFDITSPGNMLTPEQWKNWLKKKRPNQQYTYNINGQRQKAYAYEMCGRMAEAAYSASARYLRENGKTINPDFLVALSLHETGFGGNTGATKYNSWFSVGATNTNTWKNAHKYVNPEESAYSAIKTILKFTDENDWRFDDKKGPSIIGANLHYALETQNGIPGWDWSTGITGMIRGCADYNNVTIPQF